METIRTTAENVISGDIVVDKQNDLVYRITEFARMASFVAFHAELESGNLNNWCRDFNTDFPGRGIRVFVPGATVYVKKSIFSA